MKTRSFFYGVGIVLILAVMCLVLSAPQCVAFAQETFAPITGTGGAPYAPNPDGFTQDNLSYTDASLTIIGRKDRAYDTDILIFDITLKDPSQLRTAMAGKYGSGLTQAVWRLSKSVNGVLAFNGDWFHVNKGGVVVRNGKEYRKNAFYENRDILLIDQAGDFHLLVKPTRVGYDALAEAYPPAQAFSFGPALIVDGVMTTEFPENHPGGLFEKRGRLALAQVDALTYCVVATEDSAQRLGDDDAGMTIAEFAQYLNSLGYLKQAYNLDGGNSIGISMNNTRMNMTYRKNTRTVGDIVYFATLVPNGEAAKE